MPSMASAPDCYFAPVARQPEFLAQRAEARILSNGRQWRHEEPLCSAPAGGICDEAAGNDWAARHEGPLGQQQSLDDLESSVDLTKLAKYHRGISRLARIAPRGGQVRLPGLVYVSGARF